MASSKSGDYATHGKFRRQDDPQIIIDIDYNYFILFLNYTLIQNN